MINSMITIAGHLTDRVLCDEKGAPKTLPSFFPSLYQFKLKLVDRGSDGKNSLVYPHVTQLGASIGLVYAEPRAGTFKLRYGTDPATDAIDFRESAADFRTKLVALTGSTTFGLDVVFQPTPSTWMCRFTSPPEDPPGSLISLNGIENELEPETFIRVRQFTQNAETWLEVRLLQGPIASVNLFDTVLPDPPTVREIRRGYTEGDIFQEIKVNEVQAVFVPPDFAGTYILKFDGRQTIPLSGSDGTQTIEDALNALYDDALKRFVVTNPEENNAYIEFVGVFSGLPEDLIEVIIASTGNAELTFNLNLFTTEVAEALQRNATVNASFEVRLHITDPAVENDPGQDLVLFQSTITIVRPLHWEGLEAAAPINWLFPPNPKDYVPFDINQVIVGDLTYSIAFGDGIVSNYVIAHDLDSDALSVEVRENASGGRKLRDDEYSVVFDNANALTITVPGDPPASNSLLISIFASGPVSAFLNHTHSIGQIIGLQALIDSIIARLAALEALLPSIIGILPGQSLFGAAESDAFVQFTIDDKWNLIPTNRLPAADALDVKKLPPAGLLLPAVHTVHELGPFTVDPDGDYVILDIPSAYVVNGARARINTPEFYQIGSCTFDSITDTVTSAGHSLVDGRRVKFEGGVLPEALSFAAVYYVINATTDTFQVTAAAGGDPIPLLTDGTDPHTVWTVPELPGGLLAATDYFMLFFSDTTFQLSLTLTGPAIDITSVGYGPYSISTILDAPENLPAPSDPESVGQAFSVRYKTFLRASVGIPAETVVPGDIIASDGRVWYHVTRSDVPGSNSFYPLAMEQELFRVACNSSMLAASVSFTVTFNIALQMLRHDTNAQYLLVVEIAEVPPDVYPPPLGPNLFEVEWNKTPLLQQRIIVTDVLTRHSFGAQVVRTDVGVLMSNKKLYGVELAGDAVPASADFAMRARLIEFDTEDNVSDATGLIYYSLTEGAVVVQAGLPQPPETTAP